MFLDINRFLRYKPGNISEDDATVNAKERSRRRFLKEGAGLALLSQGAGGLAGLSEGADSISERPNARDRNTRSTRSSASERQPRLRRALPIS